MPSHLSPSLSLSMLNAPQKQSDSISQDPQPQKSTEPPEFWQGQAYEASSFHSQEMGGSEEAASFKHHRSAVASLHIIYALHSNTLGITLKDITVMLLEKGHCYLQQNVCQCPWDLFYSLQFYFSPSLSNEKTDTQQPLIFLFLRQHSPWSGCWV